MAVLTISQEDATELSDLIDRVFGLHVQSVEISVRPNGPNHEAQLYATVSRVVGGHVEAEFWREKS